MPTETAVSKRPNATTENGKGYRSYSAKRLVTSNKDLENQNIREKDLDQKKEAATAATRRGQFGRYIAHKIFFF
jgi:hypothetical protein